jgi:DNA-directed RNA polymerase specialized sigma subunit
MKDKIDKFTTCNYEKLLMITRKKLSYFDRNITAEVMLHEAYLYVVNNEPDKEEDIPRYIVNFINTELKYTKSSTLARHKLMSVDNDMDAIPDVVDNFEDVYDRETCLDEFIKTLDRQSQIVWEVYYYKGKRKIIEISEHFQISMSSAYQLRNEILDKFELFYKEYED